MSLRSTLSAFQDKLLEEMWKQQDSLEGPAATAAETLASPEAGGGSEENSMDSNPLLDRLRALEVKLITGSTSYPLQPQPFPLCCCPSQFLSSLKCELRAPCFIFQHNEGATQGQTVKLYCFHDTLTTAAFYSFDFGRIIYLPSTL